MTPGSSLEESVRRAFSPGGPLARGIPGFEPRPGQARMAEAWARTLVRGEILVAEAGTGIGKTLAYLVPCLLSGRKTIVSTGTKTLQQQLDEQDLPRVREALGVPVTWAVLKGRANYLCRRRWKRFSAEPLFEFAPEALRFDRMRDFAERTRTGDLSECAGIPEEFHAWSEVNARRETCDPARCDETERCFLSEARRRAAAADLVVANHHLFFADLAVGRRRTGEGGYLPGRGWGGAWGEILPPAEALVFDEAHGIEEVASSFFGISVSLARAQELARDVIRAAARAGDAWRPARVAAEEFRVAAEILFRSAGGGEGRYFLPAPEEDLPFDRNVDSLLSSAGDLSLALSLLPRGETGDREAEGDAEALLRRTRSYGEELLGLLRSAETGAVAWGERHGSYCVFHRTPVEVSGILGELLWEPAGPCLLTSATLSVGGNLAYFRERLGLRPVDARELLVDNEFDFARRALVYVPEGLPDPSGDEFPEAAARETEEVVRRSGGGALVLCTSYRILRAIADRLRESLPFPLLVQGEGPRTQLLRSFRQDSNAVLAGTGTFWEGIDVPGEALRCVVIDKLPFAPPGDPVVTARIRASRERGEDPFLSYQLPEAVLALRQGIGRLLRRQDDYGVVALLDRRVMTRGYGARFREDLPPMRWTRSRSEVESFFRRFRRGEGNPLEEEAT